MYPPRELSTYSAIVQQEGHATAWKIPEGCSRLGFEISWVVDSTSIPVASLPYLCWPPRSESADRRILQCSRPPPGSNASQTIFLVAGQQKQPRVQLLLTAFTGGQEDRHALPFPCSPSRRPACFKLADILLSPLCLYLAAGSTPLNNTNINPASLQVQPVQAPLAGEVESLKKSSRQFKQTHFRQVFWPETHT